MIEQLRHITIGLGATKHAITLHPPVFDDVIRILMEADLRRLRERVLLRGELIQIVDLDGETIFIDEADRLLDEPAALREILDARERLYSWLIQQGRALAICPACGDAKELDLAFYVVALGLVPRVTDGALIAEPGLARPSVPPPPLTRPYEERAVALRGIAPRPPMPPRASRIDFVLPSARVALAEPGAAAAGTLGDVDHVREAEMWRRWAPPRGERPEGHSHRSVDHAGFRAALRLSVALTALRDEAGQMIEPTPEAVERMFLADLQFLDALYTATHELPVETPPSGQEPRCTVHCSCGHAYFPVR